MQSLRLYTLGDPRWVADSGESGRFTLPTLLLLRLRLANTPLTKAEVIAQFWPNKPARNGRQNLRQTLFGIRKMFPHLEIRSEAEQLSLPSSGMYVDVLDAVILARNGDAARALELHRGQFLAGVRVDSIELEHWIDRLRASQARLVRKCVDQLLGSPDSILQLKGVLQGLQAVLPKDPILYVIRASIHYYEGQISQARWWLNRLPSSPPKDIRTYANELRRRLKHIPRVAKLSSGSGVFVGRAQELAILRAEWARVEGGKIRCVHLVGGVGVGKSRLSLHIAKWAAIRGGRVVHTRVASEATIPRQILNGLGYGESSADPSTTAKSRHETERSAAIAAIAREGKQRPLLLILDDYRHLHEGTTCLLRELRTVLPAPRLLVLLVARAIHDNAVDNVDAVISLPQLADDDVRALLMSINPALRSTALERAIISSADGNPLLTKRYARLTLSSNSPDVALAAIEGRDRTILYKALLRGQGSVRRHVVEVVALAQTSLSVPCLRDIIGLRMSNLRNHLAALTAEGVLRLDGSKVRMSDDYESHVLLSLVPSERVYRYHRSIARSLIGRGAKHFQAIAHHLDSAGDRRAAFAYYLKAARAQLRTTNREIIEALLASADRIAEVERLQSFRLDALKADYHYEWEEYGLAAPLYRALLRESVRLSFREQLRCRIRYLRSAASIGTQRSGYNTQRALLSAAQRLGDPELELEAAYAAFARLSDTAERAEYRQLASEFWRLSRRWPDETVAARALCQAALLYLGGARPELALRTAQFALERGKAMSAQVEFEARVVYATVEICRGDLLTAADHIRAAEALMPTLPKVPRRKLWGVNLGVYYLERGEFGQAEALLLDLYRENLRKSAGTGNIVVATNLSILYYEQQQFADAMRFARIAQELDGPLAGDSTPAHAVEGLIHWRENNGHAAAEKAAVVSNSGRYFGDHSYPALLQARVWLADSESHAIANLTKESARWRKLYYPGSARMELEALAISEARPYERIYAAAADFHKRGLLPLYQRAERLLK